MTHGVTFDLTPPQFGGTGALYIDDEKIPMEFDGEKLFFRIEKPTESDLDELDCFEPKQMQS